ncbi:hypothetical protein ACN23B_03550 [Anabaena sp. FACHB-709]|uniref:Uncharacterized protein n=2 Tax=Nostocaceae TaxID=1162 RepID=A0A1Z4KRW5_ANAVA|nr:MULTISPECIES: hypothetical protein [Nostocaceae]BAY71687.1 hypothetical protein NIES23_45070 [Trichormus variabilis NIES-23]HBW31600.1 hypothetical protein [Nostoc sp. UBA8866]MBD2172533.1 hypothetical protein [Anabaena cylindrica FACHB-318]MBD2264001.1 hypothetical protein [Anabaena sp. FACHB-709]MBD2273471.1 hypothetical protein [Nostoc sp. PCC 7120 = FACHB-418]
MKTITSLFSEESNQLQTEINNLSNIEDVVKLVQNKLDNIERIYISELNITQVRLAAFFLDVLRQSIPILGAVEIDQIETVEHKQITNLALTSSPHRLILKVLKVLLYVGILGWLFYLTNTTPGAWMGILLASVLLGLEVVLQLEKNDANLPEVKEVARPTPTVESTILLAQLADALNTIDLVVARFAESDKAKDERNMEELPELLNFLQRLMGASSLNKPQMVMELTKLLPQILMSQGIRAQIYQAKAPYGDRTYFDFEPSIDPDNQDYVTITPALLKGDRLLRRGRVIEPAYSQARES